MKTGSSGTSTLSRPSWDEVWAHVAHAVATRSLCVRAQVGAVIVDSRNRIVATGYNGPPAGFDPRDAEGESSLQLGCSWWCDRGKLPLDIEYRKLERDYSDCVALHAEANALMAADRSTWEGGAIYVLGDVCFSCAKLIANSGLSTVFVKQDNEERNYRDPQRSYEFLEACGLEVVIE